MKKKKYALWVTTSRSMQPIIHSNWDTPKAACKAACKILETRAFPTIQITDLTQKG